MLTAIFCARAFTPLEEIRDAAIVIDGARIAAIGSRDSIAIPSNARQVEMRGATLIPGFVDVHVHGAGGHDVMEASVEALDAIAETLARSGTTSFVATTVTAAPAEIYASADRIANHIQTQAANGGKSPARAECLGIHFEGPFISAKRRGVHPEQWISPPAIPFLRRMLGHADGCARILTLAPELPGAIELADAAIAKGLIVSLGHTDATYEEAMAAIQRGARHAAHVFNAMRPFSHRDTGVIGAVLTSAGVSAELIADDVHVDAAAMKMLLAAKGAAGVTLVSDGTSATGMPDGNYRLGGFDVKVSGGVVRNAEGKLAGSALTLDRALRNVVALGIEFKDVVRMLTLNPARELGTESRKGVLAAGADADLVFLDEEMRIERVVVRGTGAD
ncbi:MAG TPA: N-acetylglucosamine-6-phosphate deacetylase [Candidatus Acidoferrales bacterium]|nr:N-acetylglucosamine-6-phosphate deacetylase [Candidatus Acidoferrales bacterium]